MFVVKKAIETAKNNPIIATKRRLFLNLWAAMKAIIVNKGSPILNNYKSE